jgi:hypothetical protein
MPGAFATQPPSRPSTAPRAARVRWDRLGRVAMLFVLAALLYLYLSAGIHMFSTWGQSRSDRASVVAMEHEHTMLVHQREALGRQGTVEAEARKLGMKKQGEQQYVVSALPKN